MDQGTDMEVEMHGGYGDNTTAQRLTVIGDRQAGKSYLAVLYGVTEAYMGQKVLYESVSGDYCREQLRQCLRLIDELGLKYSSAHQSNGNLSIGFPSGGSVRCIPSGTWMQHRYDCDVHILDEGSDMVHPGAKRILRTALR